MPYPLIEISQRLLYPLRFKSFSVLLVVVPIYRPCICENHSDRLIVITHFMPGLQTDAEPRPYALATDGHRGGNKNVHSQGHNCKYVGQTTPTLCPN